MFYDKIFWNKEKKNFVFKKLFEIFFHIYTKKIYKKQLKILKKRKN